MINDKKTISILGSTGSIGVQSLDVISSKKEHYQIAYLTANSNIELLAKQISEFNPIGVVVRDRSECDKIRSLTDFKGEILCGKDNLRQAAACSKNDLVISSLVGFAGVIPTLAAIEEGITIGLANKETLVSAGNIITKAARDNNVELIAIDSEHSAILQCLAGEKHEEIEKLILTASGGPFRDLDLDEFKNITVEQALDHPNWEMGSKITIDSATMMNKGFEVIEAKWLFDIDVKDIEVVIHPQSIIHSMVQFIDGSIKAQLGLPDMRIPISYALSFPRRYDYDFPRTDFAKITELTFRQPDLERYPCLRLAFEALDQGGSATAVLNAANEIAVSKFLNRKIEFVQISQIIEKTLEKMPNIENPTLSQIIELDQESRKLAEHLKF
jgi:1-deoxy-D-xylulose-5-phosphate reductoisomerase